MVGFMPRLDRGAMRVQRVPRARTAGRAHVNCRGEIPRAKAALRWRSAAETSAPQPGTHVASARAAVRAGFLQRGVRRDQGRFVLDRATRWFLRWRDRGDVAALG